MLVWKRSYTRLRQQPFERQRSLEAGRLPLHLDAELCPESVNGDAPHASATNVVHVVIRTFEYPIPLHSILGSVNTARRTTSVR